MQRQKQQSDLGISLRDMATILETGKKLTRGAKNQLKVNTIERQQGQKQSEVSFDSKKSIDTRKENKKNDKQVKKKEPVKVSIPQQLPHYLGVPNLQKYLASDTLQVQTSYEISKYNIVELGKNYFPSLIRVLLKTNLTKELYQVKRGELKRQKTTKDQFLIEFQHLTANRNEVRSITRQNGIVLIGQNVGMLKLNFQQWKQIFAQQIQEIRRQFQSKNEKLQSSEPKQDQTQKKQDSNQHEIEKKQCLEQNYPQKIEQQKSLQFVQILPNPERQFTLDNQVYQSIENVEDEKSRKESNKIDQQKYQDSKMVPQGQQWRQIGLTQQEIFKRFCLPACEFMLWPVIIYDTGLGDQEQLRRVIDGKKYCFSEKDRSRLFEKISKSKNGLLEEKTGCQGIKKSIKQREIMMGYFQRVIRPKIEKKQVSSDKDILGSQLNLMIYPLGLNRLIRVSESMRLQLLGMDMFPQQQFMAPLILSTLLRQCSQQWCLSIMKLNEFTNLQVTQTRSQDIRSSIDRLVKCEIQKKIYKGIVLRYSNLQKKMLVMLFNKGDGVGNEVKWVGVQQVYCNYTLPQITVKSKFLLYDTNQHNCKHQTLYKLFTQIYRHYLNKQLPNNNNNVNGISNNNNNCTNNLQINQPTLSINCPQDQQLPLITQPSIPNRCTTCYYPIHRLPHYKCIFCDNYSHQQCSAKTINKSIQLNANNIPNLWTCDHCQPCVVCLQPLKYQTISCSKCHTNLHQLCAKLKPQENLIRDKYSCQNCIQCKICQKKLKNLDYVLIKNGYQCINCYKAQQANQICHICKKQSDGRWAQCSRQFCGKWIHKNCDKYIQTRNNFFSTNNQQVYYCPFCRCIEKRRLVLKFIEIISIFDQYQYFISSDYEDILDYKYVVGTPMCFRKMYERCYEGCYDRNTMNEIKTDFQLIVSNALKYNMPKDQPHYQGRILNVLGQFAFQKFREQLECTQQQIIRGGLMQRMIQKKKQLYKQVYERYLQIILNFGAKWSSVQVKRPKQNIKAIEKMLPNQLTELQISGFNSRLLLKEVFRSAMIKFKLKKKPATIQNLFQTQKVTQAYKSTINSNFCYYHYWNSNTEFYCQQCMQYYCCVQKCYRHEICRYCGVKGCACDVYTCGCGVMKQKDRKYYQKLLTEKFYDRREITENYKLCLKCAFDKLNNKQCTYCEKSYEFYYDFQTCKQCKKIYHKQCADQHASESLAKFFFKHPQKTNQSQLFSTFLRLNDHCYECSISKGNKLQMFQKLKTESLQKLAKIQKLSKYQLLIVSILFENGIKLSLCDVLGLIMDNYKQFQAYEVIFQQYRVNYASVKLNQKLKIKVDDRLQNVVKSKIISQSKRQKQVQQYKQKLIQDLQKRNRLLLRNMRYLTQQIVDSIVINIQSLWGVKVHNRMLQSYYRQEMMNDNGNALQSQLIINDKELLRQYHQHVYQGYYGKLSSSHYRLQLVLQKYQQIKNRLKSNKILSQRVQFNNISVSNNQQLTNKKMNNNNIQSINSDKTILGNNNNNNNNNNINNKNNINKAQSKNNNNDIVISKQVSNKLLFDIINGVDLFSSFQQIRITKINQINQKNNKKSSYLCINNNNTTRIGILVSSIGILVSNTIDHTIGVNFSHINNLVYDLQHYGQRYQYIGRDIISYQYIGRDIISKQHKKQQQKYKQNHSNTNNNQHQYQQRATQQIDIQSTLQQMIHQQQQQSLPTTTHYNNHNKINITQQQQLSNIHSNHTNISKLSKYQHLSKIHQIITKFILKCFQYSKSVYRRGNTCLLKTEKHHWRVLKKYTNHQIHYNNTHQNIINYNKQSVYQITLKKQHNKWFFSINQNTWWVETIEQILQKLKPIIKLNNFRQLADFLGFTFKLIPLEKAHHFSHFLRSHPLDQLSAKDKKKLVVNLYDKFQWGKNGLCKNKITNVVNNTQQISRQQMIKQQGQKQQVIPRQQTQRQQVKQFVSVKKSLFYLGRRRKQPKQQNNSIVQIKQQSLQRQQPYITYQDMKRDLQEISGQAAQKRKQLQPKQYVINQSRVFIGPSPIHKLGLFAKQNYPKFTTMIQYIGQIVSESTADVREAIFHFGCYMFGLNRRNVDRRQIIDATFRGNMARYLNHSCDPNCKAKIQLINNQPKIFIYSIREVKQFQELTYDYQFSVDANQKLTCTCGAKNCQGRLN